MIIDLVVPYVDMTDPKWLKKANDNNILISKNRFRGQGDFFKYFFRCVAKNMAWINNIFLIVQSKSQVPKWINLDKVTVVLHSDFIPRQFLPVYNSCTIEMFLHKIPNLSEHFLYANDDLYVMKKVNPINFFSQNKVKQNFISNHNENHVCGKINANGFKQVYNKEFSFKPEHALKPLLKSKYEECFNKYKKEIYNSITTTRSSQNFNVYLFVYYLDFLGLSERSSLSFKIFCCWDMSAFIKIKDIVCINDNLDINIYEDKRLNERFENLFSEKSKYEM